MELILNKLNCSGLIPKGLKLVHEQLVNCERCLLQN